MRLREGHGKIACSIVWAVLLTAALGASPVKAISPDLSLTQLGHSAWRMQDEALPGRPTAIAQTSDGYIWIGTQAGLVRFDGAALVRVAPPPQQAPRFSAIASLSATKDGSLWIGTPLQLLRWKGGRFHLYETPTGVYATVREAPDGKVWASRYHTDDDLGPLCEAEENGLTCYGAKQGIPFKNAGPLAIEKSGAIWIATANKLVRQEGGHSQIFAPPGLSRSEGLEGYTSVVVARDGSVWSGVISGGPGLGLQHFANGTWKPLISGDFDTSTWQVTALLFDRDNTLWVGTANRGIYRIRDSSIDHFGVGEGLSADTISAFCEDREGNVWVVTTNGIDKFRATRVVTFSSRQGLSSDGASAVLASKNGAIWISNATALDRIDNGTVKSYGRRDGFPGQSPTALLEDSHGRLWVGVDDGVAVFEHGRFQLVGHSSGPPVGPILEFAEDADSTVWGVTATLPSRLVRMNRAEILESISAPTGIRFGSFAAAPDGALWVSMTNKARSCDLARYANERWVMFPLHNPPNSGGCGSVLVVDARTVFVSEFGGIGTWHDGVMRKLTVDDGLPCASTFALVFDRHENLWLYQQCGVAVIDSKQILDWLSEPGKKLHFRLLDVSDGALPSRTDFHPRTSVGVDGKIWFANSVDLQFVDPEHWLHNTVVPPVQIQALHGDGRSYALGSSIVLPALTRDVQIDFTALSFAVPQRVQFQYRLEGWDTEWQRPAARRQAFYTNLRPGTYRFLVLASNDDGLWNTHGDTLEFTIEPAYYQTWWFRLALGAFLILLGWTAYSYRLRRIARQYDLRLEERVNERTRIARELHDTLLQSCQGLLLRFQVAYELLPARPTEAKQDLGVAIDRTVRAINEGRAAVQGLRACAVEGDDLAAAIKTLVEELASDHDGNQVAFRVNLQGTSRTLNAIARDEIYQIASEALRNSRRHAQASAIEVELRYDQRQLRLRVRDNGKGIESKSLNDEGATGHYGLPGMRERAKIIGGKLAIWTAHASGTEVELTVPAARVYAATPSNRLRWFLRRLSGKIAEVAHE